METKIKTYNELKVNDGIFWYGMKAIITDVNHFDNTVIFGIKPLNEKEEQIMGKFYAHGHYGGLGTLRIECWEW